MTHHYHENYGFDLEGALAKHPIKELNTPKYKDDLISSLKKGNLQSATFLKGGKEMKQFIEANPQFKTILVYDSNLKKLDTKQINSEAVIANVMNDPELAQEYIKETLPYIKRNFKDSLSTHAILAESYMLQGKS